MNGWRAAVQKADDTVSYWPIHIGTDGEFESDGSIELEEGIAASVAASMDISMDEDTPESKGDSSGKN